MEFVNSNTHFARHSVHFICLNVFTAEITRSFFSLRILNESLVCTLKGNYCRVCNAKSLCVWSVLDETEKSNFIAPV